ncbi:hypothetical protein [Undibacterium sp.]|jgi:hypothetical protein|uniref:hypothetical protein n=1 Tax=Undibacterium sp. TaxID=1914977 RepID=UPI002CA3E38D|nr:hypothetical protein [Undibacterium sp.]HTD05796.1 hypothetical protein [Undibacterium sp.]
MKLPVALLALLSAAFSFAASAQTACSYVDQKYACDDASNYQAKMQKPGDPLLTADKFSNPLAGEGRDSAIITADNRGKRNNSELAVITDSKGTQWTGRQVGSQTVYMNGKGAKVTCQTIGSQRACI